MLRTSRFPSASLCARFRLNVRFFLPMLTNRGRFCFELLSDAPHPEHCHHILPKNDRRSEWENDSAGESSICDHVSNGGINTFIVTSCVDMSCTGMAAGRLRFDDMHHISCTVIQNAAAAFHSVLFPSTHSEYEYGHRHSSARQATGLSCRRSPNYVFRTFPRRFWSREDEDAGY